MAQRVLVLLCTYNERHNLPEMISALWNTLPGADILVMDDNSPDGTGQWAQEQAAAHQPTQVAKLHVVVRPGKLGLGSALRDGIRWCLQHQYDYLINMDADQSHDPRVCNTLLDPCLADTSGRLITIGSRYVTGGACTGLSPLRQGLSRGLNLYASRLLRLPVRDCSGSYRCYPTAMLGKLDLDELACNGYGFLEEILKHLQNQGARFQEVPITYHARGSGSSKLSLADALGAISVIHRLALRR